MGGVRALLGTVLVTLAAAPAVAPRGGPAELTAAQRDTVDRGEMVLVREQRPTSAWPAVTIYVYIDATPENSAAVFTDYEHHLAYVPGLLKAKVSKVVDKATAEVDYRVAVPLFPDEDYTVRNRISRAGDDYRVDWVMLRASSTKATVGHALFRPYVNQRTRKAGTLLEYYNFVTPGSRLAGLSFIRSRSIREIAETAWSIARQAEIESLAQVPEMRQRLTALRSAVAP